jgi:hypothetical protein
MFESVTDFSNTIAAYQVPIPYKIQVALIVFIIVGLCLAGYFLRETFDLDIMRNGFSWFIFVSVINLITILVVFIYYN